MSSDPFLDLEAGIESSQPRELYKIVQDAQTTYYIATGTRDIVYNGDIYTAQPAARTDIAVASGQQDGQLTLSLPLSHGLCQRYFAQGTPPRQVVVTIYRQQVGGLTERFFGGYVFSVAIEKHIAKFALQSRLARILSRKLPVFNVTATCPHVLYDVNCRVIEANFTLGVSSSIVPVLTVTGFDGRLVTISSDGGVPNEWARRGKLIHLATGEMMTILSQEGTIIIMQAPIPGMAVGDRVTVSAGCELDIATCHTKFNNQVNFGGFPQLPTQNPFIPTGMGLTEES